MFTAENAESAEAKKNPNSKHRIPTITDIQKSNVPNPKFGNWNFGFIWDLAFRIWQF